MKFKITQKVTEEIDIKFVKMELPMRYGDKDVPFDFPRRKDDIVILLVDIETGEIKDFPKDYEGSCATKICDEGRYWLLDKDYNVLLKLDDGDYVPNNLIPPTDGYGDYVDLQISNGHITNWYKYPEIDNFLEEDND